MILEIALLDVRPGAEHAFEADFAQAAGLIASIAGYHSHELHRCLENGSRYLLLARWQTLEAHTVGFRQSAQYQEWRRLLHHYYNPFPTVEHFSEVFSNPSKSTRT